MLVDDKNYLGGSTIYQDDNIFKINNENSNQWIKKQIEDLKKLPNLTIKNRTSVAAFHGYNYLLARENLNDHLSSNERKGNIRQRL